eukprot:6241370-Amphidinium_carterae.1
MPRRKAMNFWQSQTVTETLASLDTSGIDCHYRHWLLFVPKSLLPPFRLCDLDIGSILIARAIVASALLQFSFSDGSSEDRVA